MLKKLPGIVLLILALCTSLSAETWDEPWHRDVVEKSDAFGLYEVVRTSPTRVVFKEVRHLAGLQTGPNVELTGYYSGNVVSTSTVNGVRTGESSLSFKGPGTRYYLFLKKVSGSTTWVIASPTSGFAEVQPGDKVISTFRISVHQALVDSGTYELAQTCIFRKLHGQECSPDVYSFIQTQLAAAPAAMSNNASAEEADLFFKQHAALETTYLTGYAVEPEILSKFLEDSVFHTQISAVRALRALASKERNAMLMSFVTNDSRNILARVVAVQMIRETGARELKDQIIAYVPKASSTPVGLGIAIMDPRIGTRFPASLKSALEELIAEWK